MHNEKLIKGLYDYREEHDACGIGFYANMDNKRSHDIIDKSLEMLRRLDHRGGVGADGITGDGAGIMTEIPFAFFKQHVTDFEIPGEGEYAVGLFFSKERVLGSEHEAVFKKYFEGEGLSILGYRNVPVNKDAIAKHVADTMPVIQQVFIDIRDIEDVEKRLFLARKQLEFYSTQCDLELYFTSLSRKTIVYKGWLRSDQIKKLYTDLSDDLYQSKLGLVHSRFSTNTFPSWKRAHPNRMLMHNGEINTIKGNVNWMRARQHKLIETLFGEDQHKVFQIVDEDGSDSAIVDNALEFLSLAMEPEKAAMLLIPEPWLYNEANDANVRAFYEFYSYLMEPWDGPTMISFCNGDKLGALTDRNGLRPGRYTITKDNFIVFSSEVGVVDVPESNVAFKGQLNPGKLLLVDFKQNKVIENNDLKGAIAGELPYKAWIDNHKVDFDFENIQYQDSQWKDETLFKLQRQFAYTKEEIHKYIQELVEGKKDPIGAMGYDAPIAVLNERPESLFNYFKQLFAQVTNPPIDAYREKIVTSELSYLGGEGNLLAPDETVLDRIQLKRPVLNESHLAAIDQEHFKLTYLSTVYKGDLEDALEALGREAVDAVKQGAQILVLDDSGLVDGNGFAMPMLLAISHVHQLLIKADLRMSTSLVAKSGETREVHHVACLLAYGANAIVPYLAQRTVEQLTLTEGLQGTVVDNVKTYTDVLSEGVIKVMAKMGISTVQSYQGARCMDCGTPFCQTGQQYGRETIGCPIGNYIPEWNDLVYHQDFKTAYERLSETNNFPDFTGRVCPAPCESACVMKINRESIAIKGIERTIIDEAFENGWVAPKVPSRRRDEKVAIVGSGPAGLTAAEELNLLGYQVTIYERARESGGLLMYGIPNMKLDKDVVRRRIKLMEEAGITFINGVEVGVDIDKATLESEYDAIILCTGAQKGRDLPLEGRMGDGIHFAMDYLTEQTQLLNGEIDDITITAKDKNVIIIGAGDTGADCVATALRENCKSIVQFNKYTKLPEAITFTENASWPLAMPVFKMDYAHQEYEAKFGKEPRAYGVQTMRYDVDDKGHIRGLYTQILEQGENGMVMKEGPERFWPADLVLLSIGFEGTEPTVPNAFNIKTDRNRIVADDTNYQTNNEKVFAAGDARRGQSLVVWAIKEGRGVAKAVDQYLASKVCV